MPRTTKKQTPRVSDANHGRAKTMGSTKTTTTNRVDFKNSCRSTSFPSEPGTSPLRKRGQPMLSETMTMKMVIPSALEKRPLGMR